ncbi:ORC1-type DNA replication protein 1 [Halorhabdus tiamatea SARL4B]|uniref:ORC1-type DNA replication protein n=1 Tax=Halorhabdus tiamatea SARL4B TaxID=1033806 RepID=F7PLR9_9EURY|nr:orc1/cdc6 family replication initiation protein [Halorhabdus tiamatea]ERJ07473.1 ORC1-type DNA replication protein 1 [Halorhabdus tiamatea SARL4B]
MSRFQVSNEIFKDESVLFEDWVPEDLPERKRELDAIENALNPVLRSGVAPHNTFIYGKTGQGKTASIEYLLYEFTTAVEESDEVNVGVDVINYSCAQDTSSYTVVCNLVNKITGHNPNGHPKKKVFEELYSTIEEMDDIVIFVLDEIDTIGADDEILYELPRARANGYLEDTWASVIGISNDFDFQGKLSPKTKDTLCEEEIHFKPYSAPQLRSILQRRVEKAFHEDALSENVIPLAAALAAQDKGSARQAIRYLYKAGELASSDGSQLVTEQHVRDAEELIERQAIQKGIRDLTTQDTLTLVAVLSLEVDGDVPARTRAVYSEYTDICNVVDADSIAMRRVRDHLQDLAMIGIIDEHEHDSGVRGGTHYRWGLATDLGTTIEVLEQSPNRIKDITPIINQ